MTATYLYGFSLDRNDPASFGYPMAFDGSNVEALSENPLDVLDWVGLTEDHSEPHLLRVHLFDASAASGPHEKAEQVPGLLARPKRWDRPGPLASKAVAATLQNFAVDCVSRVIGLVSDRNRAAARAAAGVDLKRLWLRGQISEVELLRGREWLVRPGGQLDHSLPVHQACADTRVLAAAWQVASPKIPSLINVVADAAWARSLILLAERYDDKPTFDALVEKWTVAEMDRLKAELSRLFGLPDPLLIATNTASR